MDMIPNLKQIAAAAMLLGLFAGKRAPQMGGEKIKPMNHEIQLIWTATVADLEHRREIYFIFSPGHGLTDIDFHPITAREWPVMKSPTVDAVARLQVTKETTVAQLQEVIRQLADKGGYKTVITTVGM